MGIYTYMMQGDRERWSRTSNDELNKLLAEARAIIPGLLVREVCIEIHRFLRKTRFEKRYVVYYETHPHEKEPYQAQYHTGASGDAKNVMSHLYGILTAANYLNKTNPPQGDAGAE